MTNPMVMDSSTTTSPISTSPPSFPSAVSTSGTPDSSTNNEEPNHGSLGGIIGGIIGGVAALILLLLYLWYRRRNKKEMPASNGEVKLDMEENSSGVVVEPFIPNTQPQLSGLPEPNWPLNFN